MHCNRLAERGARFRPPPAAQREQWALLAHFGEDGRQHRYYWRIDPAPSARKRKLDFSTPTPWAPWYSSAVGAAPQNRAAAACEAALAEATKRLATYGKPDAWRWFSVLFDPVDGTPILQPTCEANQLLGDGTAERYAAEIVALMRAAFDASGPERGQPSLLEISGQARAYLEYVHRAKKVGQSDGKAGKRLPGIWKRVRELVKATPTITSTEAWNSFPDEREAERRDVLIYRDGNDLVAGNKLVEVDDRTGKERTITYDTFRGYLKAAKKTHAG
jgi:hypothetical protein